MVVASLLMLMSLACSSEEPVQSPVVMSPVSNPDPYQDYLTKEDYVTFSQGIGEPALLKLLEQKDLQPLRSISIHGRHYSSVRTRHHDGRCCFHVHSLYLQGSTIGDEGLKAIAEAPRLAQLQHINLDKVGQPPSLAALAASLLKPESLSLGSKRWAMKALWRSPRPPVYKR